MGESSIGAFESIGTRHVVDAQAGRLAHTDRHQAELERNPVAGAAEGECQRAVRTGKAEHCRRVTILRDAYRAVQVRHEQSGRFIGVRRGAALDPRRDDQPCADIPPDRNHLRRPGDGRLREAFDAAGGQCAGRWRGQGCRRGAFRVQDHAGHSQPDRRRRAGGGKLDEPCIRPNLAALCTTAAEPALSGRNVRYMVIGALVSPATEPKARAKKSAGSLTNERRGHSNGPR